MESQNKDELVVREASTYEIKFPDNKFLSEPQKKRIQKAVEKGGVSIGNETYIADDQLPKLFSTDKAGATNIIMEVPPEDLRTIGDREYVSTPEIQKKISQRRQQPRGLTEQEKLGYAKECVDAFSNNPELNKKRAIEAERIAKERSSLGKKVIEERQSTVSELSGRPLEDKAEVHHKDRVADKPERAFDPTNLTVILDDEHLKYTTSDYPQNEKGYSQFEIDYKKE